MDETRHARLGNRILHELGRLLMNGEIKDHRVDRLVSFSYIKLAKDGATARVGVSSILDDHRLQSAVDGLNSAAGYLQSRVGRVIRTRSTPRLHFVVDRSIEEGQEVIRVINELEISDDDSDDERRDSPSQQADGD